MTGKLYRIGVCAFLMLCWLLCAPQHTRADENKEYLVKAAFIYNFVKFVEWPEIKAIAKQNNMDICILGSSPIAKAAEVFKAGSTSTLTLTLTQENNVSNVPVHCHIVFISRSEAARLPEILNSFKGKPVLTVSDIDGFAEQGGMIGFVMKDNRVKIEVNTQAVSAAGMRVDAQLLEIALKVIGK